MYIIQRFRVTISESTSPEITSTVSCISTFTTTMSIILKNKIQKLNMYFKNQQNFQSVMGKLQNLTVLVLFSGHIWTEANPALLNSNVLFIFYPLQ